MAPESTFCNLGTDLLHSQVMEEKPASRRCAPFGLNGTTDIDLPTSPQEKKKLTQQIIDLLWNLLNKPYI